MAPSPVGIVIRRGGNSWKVGKEIGSGACAAVHELIKADGGQTEYAVKVTPVPKKKTKKGNSPEERNYSLLHYEQMVYQTQFQNLQGTIIPRLPTASKDPPITGEENGYKYFVMERMESTISSIVPLLLQNKESSKTIPFGPIAVKLLQCLQAIHECGNIVRDVKAENFMLIFGEGKGSQTLEKRLASRIRLIDLAIVAQSTSMYMGDNNSSGLNGTPLYTSLNVHGGQKVSFRDDLESLGYVIAELLIQLHSGDTLKQLPWSHGQSDKEIGSIKESHMNDEDSVFYKELGNAKTAQVFSEYMDIVRGYSFKKRPDYDQLAQVLSKLSVPRTKAAVSAVNAASSKSSAKPTPRRATAKRVATKEAATGAAKRTRSKSLAGPQPEDLDDKSTCKVARRSTRRDMEVDNDAVLNDGTNDNVNDSMDWEYTVDENEEPEEEDAKPRARAVRSKKASTVEGPSKEGNRLQRRGVRISIIEGPHKNESFELEMGGDETLIIGSSPSSKVGTLLALKKDKELAKTHVRLDLNVKKKLITVAVTDKSNGDTSVNYTTVKNTKAFINDTIRIGSTGLNVQPL